MTTAVLLGLLGGLGAAGLLFALAPRRLTMTSAIAHMDGGISVAGARGLRGHRRAVAVAVARWMEQRKVLTERAANDLDLLELDLADAVAESMRVIGVVVVIVLSVIAALTWIGYLRLDLGLLVGGVVGSVVVGTGAEILAIRQRARAARDQFRRALGLFLLLVSQCLAAGLGIQGALKAAGETSPTRAFGRILGTLERARATGQSPWSALADLGIRWQIPDFAELANTIDLAGNQGAKVRESLAAKAASMRKRDMAETEASASAITERMFLPSTIMFLGFLVVVGYPALAAVTRIV